MDGKVFYHYDRRKELKNEIGKKTFKNNLGKLNGFFMGLVFASQAKEDFGKDLFSQISNFLFYEEYEFNFRDKILSIIYEKENIVIIKKVLYEFIFEELRRKEFNHKPSRLKSIFVVEERADLEEWRKALNGDGDSFKLTSIKIDLNHKADAKWFEKSNFNDLDSITNYARNYWNGIITDNPKIESLIVGEFICEVI